MNAGAGIPSRFEIGFPLPEDRQAESIPGYHCWGTLCERYGLAWISGRCVPRAWKHPDKNQLFFRAHDGQSRAIYCRGATSGWIRRSKGNRLTFHLSLCRGEWEPLKSLVRVFVQTALAVTTDNNRFLFLGKKSRGIRDSGPAEVWHPYPTPCFWHKRL